MKRAMGFLEEEMAAGQLRSRDPGLVLIAAYLLQPGLLGTLIPR